MSTSEETTMILEAIGQIERKLITWREALISCRREAQRERMDYRVILRTVNEALGDETGPENSREEMSPVLNGTLDARAERLAGALPREDWHPLIAPGVIMAIGQVLDQNGTTRPGDKIIRIGELVDEWKLWLPTEPQCEDCGRPYSDPGFCDLVVPDVSFAKISDSGDENGLFCPSCLLARLARKGVSCDAKLMSGPVYMVEQGARPDEPEKLQREQAVATVFAAARGAANTFRVYAELHNQKGTEEGKAKALANITEAENLEAALTAADSLAWG